MIPVVAVVPVVPVVAVVAVVPVVAVVAVVAVVPIDYSILYYLLGTCQLSVKLKLALCYRQFYLKTFNYIRNLFSSFHNFQANPGNT